jgi:hypothetical protein
MAFDNFLVHTCTILIARSGEEVDEWNRPIQTKDKIENVPCRFVTKEKSLISETGTSKVTEMYLLFGPDAQVSNDMEITNVRDDNGGLLFDYTLKTISVAPKTGMRSRHHYKVYVKGGA